MLSQILGLRESSSAAISQALLEQFEPIKMLAEIEEFFSEKYGNLRPEKNAVDQQLQQAKELSINNLKNIFSKFFDPSIQEFNILKNGTIIDQISNALKIELLPQFSSLGMDSASDLSKNIEKIVIALKQLPENIRNNISAHFAVHSTNNIESIANSIVEKLGMTTTGIANNTDNATILKLTQLIEKMPSSVIKDISLALLGSPKVEPSEIANYLFRSGFIANTDGDSDAKGLIAVPSTRQIIALLREIGLSIVENKNPIMANQGQAQINGISGKPDNNKLISVIEKMPSSIGMAIASVITGSSETKIHDIANAINNLNTDTNTERGIASKLVNAEPSLRQIISLLQELSRINQSDINSKINNVETQKIAQILENLPTSLKRAIALAITHSPETNNSDIVTIILQKSNNSIIGDKFFSILEKTSPLLRQVIAAIAKLPLDAQPQQIAQALVSGEKHIYDIAKALIAHELESEEVVRLGAGNRDVAMADQKNQKTSMLDTEKSNLDALEKAVKFSVSFSDRLGYLLQFENLASQHGHSVENQNTLSSWFRSIIDQLIMAKSAKSGITEHSQTSKHSSHLRDPKFSNSMAEQLLRQNNTTPGEKTQTWEMWMKNSIKALVDPSISSKEALFHNILAKEDVNYFHLPLPWMPNRFMEMWVEADDTNSEKMEKGIYRVLLALDFSVLGQTRVGMESSGKRLWINIWAEHPYPIEAELDQMQNEISSHGFDVHLKLHELPTEKDGVVPSIKSFIAGTSLHALG
ncbi:MAG: hypothetical protein FWG02_01370 [Holophagaceae bacterium]|nr:hypothetical protein [Holophagaceae bacterium]